MSKKTTDKSGNRYLTALGMGSSHEEAVIFDTRAIVDEELKYPRESLEDFQLHTVISNQRQDISAITILLAGISQNQKKIKNLLMVISFLITALISILLVKLS